MGLTVALPVLFWATARQPGREGYRKAVRFGLAGLLLLNWIGFEMIQAAAGQFTLINVLPMQLCDWAMIAVMAALVTRRRGVYEVAYFWAMAGTLQAVITPNLDEGFPSARFFDFFIDHCGIVIGVLILTLVEGLRPRPASIMRAILWTEVYFVVALIVNAVTGADYGFISQPPEAKSLLSYLSSNHVMYLVEMHLLEVVFYLILYVPFLVIDLARRGRDGRAG